MTADIMTRIETAYSTNAPSTASNPTSDDGVGRRSMDHRISDINGVTAITHRCVQLMCSMDAKIFEQTETIACLEKENARLSAENSDLAIENSDMSLDIFRLQDQAEDEANVNAMLERHIVHLRQELEAAESIKCEWKLSKDEAALAGVSQQQHDFQQQQQEVDTCDRPQQCFQSLETTATNVPDAGSVSTDPDHTRSSACSQFHERATAEECCVHIMDIDPLPAIGEYHQSDNPLPLTASLKCQTIGSSIVAAAVAPHYQDDTQQSVSAIMPLAQRSSSSSSLDESSSPETANNGRIPETANGLAGTVFINTNFIDYSLNRSALQRLVEESRQRINARISEIDERNKRLIRDFNRRS